MVQGAKRKLAATKAQISRADNANRADTSAGGQQQDWRAARRRMFFWERFKAYCFMAVGFVWVIVLFAAKRRVRLLLSLLSCSEQDQAMLATTGLVGFTYL